MARKKRRSGGAGKGLNASGVRFLNPAQVGGIETSVLDDGPGRGVRIAWFNTGTPLRFKVVIDRGLDIADAFYGGCSLAYLSYVGPTPPNRALDRGKEWLKSFFAGLLTSCGPVHMQGEIIEGMEYGQHGPHSNTPAAVEAIVQPDPASGITEMSITGVCRTARMFGPNLELRRTISAELGDPCIRIHDRFFNRGNQKLPHSWLLHINFGWPLLDKGARFVYRGPLRPWRPEMDTEWFTDPAWYKNVQAPSLRHVGTGEAVAVIDPPADKDGRCHMGLANPALGLAVEVIFPKAQFPRMLNWQHMGPYGEYVSGMEPISFDPYSPSAYLRPGAVKEYDCCLRVMDAADDIAKFIRRWG
jgi:hypothetical protein